MGRTLWSLITRGNQQLLARSRNRCLMRLDDEKVVLASPVVCHDETSAGEPEELVGNGCFVTTVAVLHVSNPSRGKAVVTALFGEIRPRCGSPLCWAAKRANGVEWQVCLARLLRTPNMQLNAAIRLQRAFRKLLLRAIAMGQRGDAEDTT